MSERLSAPDYIDVNNPDYEKLMQELSRYFVNMPMIENLTKKTGDALVATIIWFAKDINPATGVNQSSPELVISAIFGPDVWESGQWT